VAQHHPTGSETPPPYAPQSNRYSSEPPSVEDDVDIWRYAILALHARNDDDECMCVLVDVPPGHDVDVSNPDSERLFLTHSVYMCASGHDVNVSNPDSERLERSDAQYNVADK